MTATAGAPAVYAFSFSLSARASLITLSAMKAGISS
jgi:hypothetical protein